MKDTASWKFIESYFDKLNQAVKGLRREDIQKAADILFKAWQDEATIFIMGNGGSASTATHFVCDLSKCTVVEGKKRFRVIGLNDNVPLVSAWTNDSGFGSIFAEQLKPFLKENDVLIGLSVHGGSGDGDAGPWSQNLVKAMRLAQDRKAKIIGFSGFDGGAMKKMADVCIVVPLDSEPWGTPIIESVHVAIEHLICNSLKEKIKDYEE
jgi:D-sedoheptulose 7-phosphate isomerase